MATSENSRSKLGSKREVAPGKWVIRVQAGFRADGHVRRVSRTVYGTETEADIAIAQLAQELGVSQAAHAGVTLDMYYWGVFRDSPSNRGKPRSKASLREYDGQMCNYISPVLGSIDISEITHDMMRSCIERSGAPAKTKTTLRAVMRRAFDDGWVTVEPFRRRVIALERVLLASALQAKMQVTLILLVQFTLKLHWRTDIYGYRVMHKAPPRHTCRGGASAYGLAITTWSPSSSRYGVIAMPRSLSTTM